jgi:hypothetical protein
MMRGENEVKFFGRKMVETLNLPKNIDKGDWLEMSLAELKCKLAEEINELFTEIEIAEANDFTGLVGITNESVDVANVAMMLREKALALLMAQG